MTAQPCVQVEPGWEDVVRGKESCGEFWVSRRCCGATAGTETARVSGGLCVTADPAGVIAGAPAYDAGRRALTLTLRAAPPEEAPLLAFVHPARAIPLAFARPACCSISADGTLCAAGGADGKAAVYETSTGEVVAKLEGHVDDITRLQFFPSGVVILTGSLDMQMKIWDAKSGVCAATLRGHKRRVTDFAMIGRGRNLVSCAVDGTVKLWECSSQSVIATLFSSDEPLYAIAMSGPLQTETETPRPLEFGTEGRTVAFGGGGGRLRVADVRSAALAFEAPLPSGEDTSPLTCCCFLEDTVVAAGYDSGHVRLWDARHPTAPVHTLDHLYSGATHVARVSSHEVAVSSGDGSLLLWDSTTNAIPVQLTGPNCDPVPDFECTETTCVTVCRDGKLRVYEVAWAQQSH
eukprot:TRINITY_DN5626_c0_g2_i1.p1 TRINITY_DN5626_c0_g2~~TRINITY_DN5626_c0_g2_i1.p1  ORF type:complete len:416 (-),score=92.48 TRINITY_DN5626_c0_g2_i1:56-1273(-)